MNEGKINNEEEELIHLEDECTCPKNSTIDYTRHPDDIPDECEACQERSILLNKISNRECIMMAAEGNTDEEFYNKERWVKYFKDGGCHEAMEECIRDLEYEENDADYLSKLTWLKELFREWNNNK